jgi:hypothetical protein
MTTKRASSPFDLCKHEFADGRGCAMPAIPSLNGYCRSHASVLKSGAPVEHNEDLLQEIGLFTEDPPTEEDVHRAMARVFRALAANRISTRRAATFGYLAQLLLTSRGSKKSRHDSGPLSEMFLKLACNPAFRILDPASKAAAIRSAQERTGQDRAATPTNPNSSTPRSS